MNSVRLMTTMLVMMMVAPVAAGAGVAVELKGSPASMERQNRIAAEAGYAFAETVADIDALVEEGVLTRLTGNDHYEVMDWVVSDAALPEMKLFIERLAEQYFEATGEKLVVTSLTRPTSLQPPNSHALSVHPTGAAVDLRISQKAVSRQWLETALLKMEREGLLDITREKHPPHYHIALFPAAYRGHVEALIGPYEVARALGEIEEVVQQVPSSELLVAAAVVDEEVQPRQRRSFWAWLRAIFVG